LLPRPDFGGGGGEKKEREEEKGIVEELSGLAKKRGKKGRSGKKGGGGEKDALCVLRFRPWKRGGKKRTKKTFVPRFNAIPPGGKKKKEKRKKRAGRPRILEIQLQREEKGKKKKKKRIKKKKKRFCERRTRKKPPLLSLSGRKKRGVGEKGRGVFARSKLQGGEKNPGGKKKVEGGPRRTLSVSRWRGGGKGKKKKKGVEECHLHPKQGRIKKKREGGKKRKGSFMRQGWQA